MNAILLQAELLELKGSPHGPARGVVIESKLDKGRGAMATILVNRGTLRRGDNFVVGAIQGKVRKLLDENGRELKEVGPARPVQVLGITGVPQAGDLLTVYPSEKEARQVMLKKQQLIREQDHQKIKKFSLESLTKEIQDGEVKELAVIIKADAAGSVEAIADEIMKIVSDEVRVDVVHKAVGAITENDVMLAAASKAIIIGFHVHPTLKAREESHNHGVDIRIYRIIYDITQDIRLALEGMLNPEYQEEITATLEVRQVFKISRVGTVAGCMVVQGKISRNHQVRLLRDNVEIFTGRIEALKRFKDDAKEVAQGFECGLQLVNYNDIKVGDIVEAFQLKEVKRTLAE
jgi:translation initiation factor IF-2